jgi:hypothetical protein
VPINAANPFKGRQHGGEVTPLLWVYVYLRQVWTMSASDLDSSRTQYPTVAKKARWPELWLGDKTLTGGRKCQRISRIASALESHVDAVKRLGNLPALPRHSTWQGDGD